MITKQESKIGTEYVLFRKNKYVGTAIYQNTIECGNCFVRDNSIMYLNIDYFVESSHFVAKQQQIRRDCQFSRGTDKEIEEWTKKVIVEARNKIDEMIG